MKYFNRDLKSLPRKRNILFTLYLVMVLAGCVSTFAAIKCTDDVFMNNHPAVCNA